MNYDNKIKNKNRKKVLSLAAILFIIGAGASMLYGIDEAEASATEIDIAPGMRYTYTPTFPDDLNPAVTIKSQGTGTTGTDGSWATMSGKQVTVKVPESATPGSQYQVTLRATTTNPTQTLDIPIVFAISSNMITSGYQPNIVTGDNINFLPTVTGMGTFTWSVSSGKTLPEGLTLNSSTGKVTGIPETMGEQNIHLTATSSYGETANLTVTFTIFSKLVATNSPENGAVFYV